MSENTMVAIILSTAIASCSACSITDRIVETKGDATKECVKRAWTEGGRVECLKASPR